jgi:hypothetical protein
MAPEEGVLGSRQVIGHPSEGDHEEEHDDASLRLVVEHLANAWQ